MCEKMYLVTLHLWILDAWSYSRRETYLCQVHQGVSLIIEFPLLHLHTAQSGWRKEEEDKGGG